MKTFKIGLGIAILFLLVALTGMKKKNNYYSSLKGGETKTEVSVLLD